MRGRTANELKDRAKLLIYAIQLEHEEYQRKVNKSPQNVTSSSDDNKENDKEFHKNQKKKSKRKSWMPTLSFANEDEPKAKKTVKFDDDSTSNGIASTSGSANKSFANTQTAFDMSMLD